MAEARWIPDHTTGTTADPVRHLTWTYDPTFTAPRDTIRFLTFDTDYLNPLLADEEVNRCIALEAADPTRTSAQYRIAAMACFIIATRMSGFGDQAVGDVRNKFNERAADYTARADDYRERARQAGGVPYAGGITLADKQTADLDLGRTHPMFTRDMLTPPGVGTGAYPTRAPLSPGALV